MPEDKTDNKIGEQIQRVKVTALISLEAYDAINQIQLEYRKTSGRNLPQWKVLDSAIIAHAKRSSTS